MQHFPMDDAVVGVSGDQGAARQRLDLLCWDPPDSVLAERLPNLWAWGVLSV